MALLAGVQPAWRPASAHSGAWCTRVHGAAVPLTSTRGVGCSAPTQRPSRREMRREANGRYNGTMTFFKDEGPQRYMPPNAGVQTDKVRAP